jgi:hypothetical protein
MEPAHLQGVMKGLDSSSASSRQILQALPLSNLPWLSFKPPGFLSYDLLIPLKKYYVVATYLANDI